MSDTVSEKKRSEIMKASKPKGNKSTEKALIELFKEHRIKGWKRNYRIAGAFPDFVFPKLKIAIFADGCFWHGHNCRTLRPKTNRKYWDEKIKKNRERDKAIKGRIEAKGWTVFRIWECEIKKGILPNELIELLKWDS
ncbi:very short patch repair endonuclease [bacterium]|nr:MAG: very short patch repair endonuclease [bacterium]